MKGTARVFAALLALLICCGVFSACGGGASNETDEVTTVPAQQTTDTLTTTEYVYAPPAANFDGADFMILSAGQVAYDDFSFTDIDAEVLPVEQYRRKSTIEEQYGVKIVFTQQKDTSTTRTGPGYNLISQAVTANETVFHLGLIGGYDVAPLAYSNYLYALNKIDQVDLENEWWDADSVKDLNVRGINFFVQGDLTASKSTSTFAIYYNKELGRTALTTEDNPYEIVKSGKWTIDKLSELCLKVSEELNGDDRRTMEDRYGIYVWDDSVIGMISASGEKLCSVDANGELALTIYNDRVMSVIEKYGKIAYNTDYAIEYQRISGNNVRDHWLNDQALFWATSLVNTAAMREMDSDFGILPYPKLSEEQERYFSTIAPYNSQFICIPLIQEDMELTGTITEVLGYYGREIVRPAVYEKTIKGTYFRDDESTEMLDIIFNNYVYDLGYLYRVGKLNSELIYMFRAYSTDFTSRYEASLSAATATLETINESYKTAVEDWK